MEREPPLAVSLPSSLGVRRDKDLYRLEGRAVQQRGAQGQEPIWALLRRCRGGIGGGGGD